MKLFYDKYYYFYQRIKFQHLSKSNASRQKQTHTLLINEGPSTILKTVQQLQQFFFSKKNERERERWWMMKKKKNEVMKGGVKERKNKGNKLTWIGIISRNIEPTLNLLNLRINLRPREIEELRGVELVLLINLHVTVFNKILHLFLLFCSMRFRRKKLIPAYCSIWFCWRKSLSPVSVRKLTNTQEKQFHGGKERDEREGECMCLYIIWDFVMKMRTSRAHGKEEEEKEREAKNNDTK